MSAVPPSDAQPFDPSRGGVPPADRLGAALSARRRECRVPALSAAVAHGGRVVWADAAGAARLGLGGGPAEAVTTDTVFRVGSITKPLTAVAVLRLVAAGRLGLGDAVGRHLPEAPAPDATLAELLTHTAGLPAEPPGPWWERGGAGTWEDLVASGVTPVAAPGERFHYSNVGYAVLGRLVATVHGRDWDAVVRDEVTGPLGMDRTGRTPTGPAAAGYAVHPHADAVLPEPVVAYGAMGPAGEAWSTPGDLAVLGSWLVGAGPWASDDAVLPLAWRRRMTAPRVVVDEPGSPFTAAWGLGVSVHHPAAGRRTAGHGGSVPGFTATLRADPASTHVVAVCGSSTAGFGDAGFLTELLPPSPPAGPPSPGAAAGDADLTGAWYWGPVPFVVSLLPGGRLELRAADEDGRRTVFASAPGEPGAWVGVEGGYWWAEPLRPTRSDGGSPVALDVGTFHLTRTPYDPGTEVPGGLDAAGWRPWAPA